MNGTEDAPDRNSGRRIGHWGSILHEDSASHFIFMNISNCCANKGHLEHNKSGLSTKDGVSEVSSWNCLRNCISLCFQKEHHWLQWAWIQLPNLTTLFTFRRCNDTLSIPYHITELILHPDRLIILYYAFFFSDRLLGTVWYSFLTVLRDSIQARCRENCR